MERGRFDPWHSRQRRLGHSERTRVTVSGMAGKATSAASRLGLAQGDVVGEFGFDDDVDEELRESLEAAIGSPLSPGDADEVFDAVLVWWREDDGDLTDELVDVITVLADDGVVLLATPRPGRDGYVDTAEIGDAAETAGLGQPSSGQAAGDWVTVKLARSRQSGKVRR
jgi:hypothetical protein